MRSCSAAPSSEGRQRSSWRAPKSRKAPKQGDRVTLRPRPDEAHLFDSGERRAAGALMSAATGTARSGRTVPRRDPRAAGGAPASARAGGRVRGRHEGDARPSPRGRPSGRPRLVRCSGLLRRVRVRAAAGLDCDAGLDLAHRLLRREARSLGLGRHRALAVGRDTGRRRVREARARERGVHGRDHERSGVEPCRRGGCDSRRSRPGRSVQSRRRRRFSTRWPRWPGCRRCGRARQRDLAKDCAACRISCRSRSSHSSKRSRTSQWRSPTSAGCT